MSQTS